MSQSAKKKVLFLTIGPPKLPVNWCVLLQSGSGGLPRARYRVELPVVVPGVGVQRAIAGKPHAGATKLVRSRARQELKLRVAAAHFRIDRSDDNADFADQVRTHVGRGSGIRSKPRAAGRIDAVALYVRRTETAQAGKTSTHAVGVDANARDQTIEIQHVVADGRQLLTPWSGKGLRRSDELDVASSVSAATVTSTSVLSPPTTSVKFKRTLSALPS